MWKFQISIRTLFLMMLIVACGFGYLSIPFSRARGQHHAVQVIESLHGSVTYDYQIKNLLEASADFDEAFMQPPPKTLFGKDFSFVVKDVNLSNTEVTDSDLFFLEDLQSIDYLSLENTNIHNTSLQLIGQCRNLETLDLEGCPISNLQELKHLKNLIYLRCSNTSLDAESVQVVKRFDKLKLLTLANLNLTDDSVAFLSELPLLWCLDLSGNRITDQTLIQICENHPRLERLRLDNTLISDHGLKAITKCQKLKELSISNTKLTDQAVDSITKLPNLHFCFLDETKLSREGQERISMHTSRVVFGK